MAEPDVLVLSLHCWNFYFFLSFCCRCHALFIVAMYFVWSPYPLFSVWTEISFSVRVLCLFFLLLEYLARCRRAIFVSTSLNRFFCCWNLFYVFSYCIFIAEINFTCLCIPELYFCYWSSPFRKLYSSLVASVSVENFSKFQFHHARVPYEGIAERKRLAGLMDYFPHCAGLDTLHASSWNRNWSRMISEKMFIH